MKKVFILLSSLFFGGASLFASSNGIPNSVRDSITIFFKTGRSELELSFIDNAGRMSSARHQISQIYEAGKISDYNITIYAGASPEGEAHLNDGLSTARAEVLIKNLMIGTPLSGDKVKVRVMGVDWGALARLVEESNMQYKEEMLNILRNVPEKVYRNGSLVYARKTQAEALHGGAPYKWMLDNLFKRLRYASIVIEEEKVPVNVAPTSKIGPVAGNDEEGDLLARRGRGPRRGANNDSIEVTTVGEDKGLMMAVKTNVLYDAMALPNIGAEFYLKNNWSLTGNWMYSWWSNDNKHRYWRIYGGDLGARKWLGRQAEQKKLTGHHVGFFVQGLTYDVEFGSRGYLSDNWNFGASFEYGFSLPISKRINFDFSVGLGYFGGKNKKYLPGIVDGEERYIWQETNHMNWFGPTKAEASLVILLGKGVK